MTEFDPDSDCVKYGCMLVDLFIESQVIKLNTAPLTSIAHVASENRNSVHMAKCFDQSKSNMWNGPNKKYLRWLFQT